MSTYDGWYLLDHHRNRAKTSGPAGAADTRPWYTTRQTCQHGYRRPHLIVIHTPETLEDFTAPYDEAERIAEYGSNTTRASWHDTVDADSIIPMLPPGYTAWHVRGFNRCGIGMEVGAKATSWDRAPQAWVDGVIRNAAWRAAQHAATFDIPAVPLFTPGRRYTSPISPAGVGFVGHHPLDPTRRTDPGFDFPWDRFLNQVDAYLEGDEMVDRDTDLGGSPTLADAFRKSQDVGMSSEHTKPGHIVTVDKLAAFLDRLGLLDPQPSGDDGQGHVALSEVRELRRSLHQATKD